MNQSNNKAATLEEMKDNLENAKNHILCLIEDEIIMNEPMPIWSPHWPPYEEAIERIKRREKKV